MTLGQSLQKGQWEAAHSLGLSTYDTYRYVILPQAIQRILPPLTSQVISLIKDSALVSTIAIYDLTMKGQEIIAETYLVFELWFTIAGIYLILTVSLSLATQAMGPALIGCRQLMKPPMVDSSTIRAASGDSPVSVPAAILP